jgi:hypothetical protein
MDQDDRGRVDAVAPQEARQVQAAPVVERLSGVQQEPLLVRHLLVPQHKGHVAQRLRLLELLIVARTRGRARVHEAHQQRVHGRHRLTVGNLEPNVTRSLASRHLHIPFTVPKITALSTPWPTRSSPA